MTQTAKTSKNVKTQIVARYFIKRNGHIVYAVRSSNGKDLYHTTIINGKATGCTCPSHLKCYHMGQLEQIEAERNVQTTPALQPVSLAQVVEQEVKKCQQAREAVELAPLVADPKTAKEWNAVYARQKSIAQAGARQYHRSLQVVKQAQEVAA